MSKKILYLIDGTSLCYRSFFAIKLSTSKGLPVGAVYGFYQTLKKIISKYDPEYLGICFDVSRKTFRQEKFKEYKIKRPPLPDSLRLQFPLIKKLITALGIKIIEKEGFEADDVIASLCSNALESDLAVVIVSPDKDFCQLINEDKVRIYNYNKDKFITKNDFLNDYGFAPDLMVDYLSLAGDASDNIPGAKGIGKVGAAKLIKEFRKVENIFNNLNKIPQKLRDILTKDKEMIFLSKQLATLCLCDLGLTWKDLKVGEPDSAQVYNMFNEFGFKTFLKELPTQKLNLKLQIKEKISKSVLQRLVKKPLVFSFDKNEIFIFDNTDNCIYKSNVKDIKPILEDQKIKKVSHGFKAAMLTLSGSCIKGLWFDVKIASYLVDSSLIDYSLIDLVSHYLGQRLSDIPLNLQPYFIYKLYRVLDDKLKEEELGELFFNVEMPLIDVLSKMQRDGVKVDIQTLQDLYKAVNNKNEKAKCDIFKITGRRFNLNSPKQLAGILFGDLKIKPIKKTKTGYSTNEEVLTKLSSQHEIAGFILEYRQLNKLKTTYIEPFMEQVKEAGGILHAQFNQTSTHTGRLSSSSPNLQSIPVKGEFSLSLRKAFIPSFTKGHILSGDYSQIELRILAHLSGDENLIRAFREDLDIHSFTASLLFSIEESHVTDIQRNLAKRVNFGLTYGMSAYGLSKELEITPFEAQNFIDDYFKRYPKVKDYTHKILAYAQKKGYVKTILGRKRKLPDVNSSDIRLREFAHRQAINAPIQGSCADLIKVAMVRIYKQLEKKKFKTKLIMQIHDDLVFDVAQAELEELIPIVREHMEKAMELIVPVRVSLKVGKNWGQMQAV